MAGIASRVYGQLPVCRAGLQLTADGTALPFAFSLSALRQPNHLYRLLIGQVCPMIYLVLSVRCLPRVMFGSLLTLLHSAYPGT